MQERIKAIAGWLRRFIEPDQVTELRALAVGGSETWAGLFTGRQLEAMAQAAISFETRSKGVYFVPNPLKTPAGTKLGEVAKRSTCANDDDVIERRWLLIDIDPVRFDLEGKPLPEQSVPTTEAEREAGWQCLLRCKSTMDAAGFQEAIMGDSGNGWHLCYPVRLPNNDDSKAKHKALLVGLNEICGDDRAHVDLKTFNASRIWKLPGTLTRKGSESTGRPFRWSHCVGEAA
jgi:hypothetical protein